MALTLKEALELKEGTILSFGDEFTYKVTAAEMRDHGRGVYLVLKRDDGFDTHATQHVLHKAVIVAEPAPPADAPETIIAPNATAEQLEALGGDPEIQQENAAIAEEELADWGVRNYPYLNTGVTVNALEVQEVSTVLPPEPVPEPSPVEAASPKTQAGDDTAVDNKSVPKGKGKGKKA